MCLVVLDQRDLLVERQRLSCVFEAVEDAVIDGGPDKGQVKVLNRVSANGESVLQSARGSLTEPQNRVMVSSAVSIDWAASRRRVMTALRVFSSAFVASAFTWLRRASMVPRKAGLATNERGGGLL